MRDDDAASSYRTFSRTADRAASVVLANYSTSFSFATLLLGRRMRQDIRHLYAVVRIADELVDGAAQSAGLSTDTIRTILDAYEEQVLTAPQTRFHTDPVLQSYADTARRCEFDPEHLKAFFASMRMDVQPACFDAATLERYIYGSAKVIGLLCLQIFFQGRTPDATTQQGAQALGAAFQRINFLRDFAADSALGRDYFGLHNRVDAASRDEIIAQIREELITAQAALPALPLRPRVAVMVATALFAGLTEKLARTSPEVIMRRRVRLSLLEKVWIVSRTFWRKG